MFQAIICDPDEHKYKGNFMGLFYTALSRATTLGDANGSGSAIYFRGNNFTQERFCNLGKMKNSDEDCIPIQKRSNWVTHLRNNTTPIIPLTTKMNATLHWAQSASYNYDNLHHRIKQYTIANMRRDPDTF